MKPRAKQQRQREAGNVLIYILIGIVLFGALSYTFARISSSTGKVSTEDARVNAQEIISYAEKVAGAVQNVMLQNGCLTSQLSFENSTVAGYTNGPAPAKCKIFDPAGGGVIFEVPATAVLDTTSAAAGVAPASGLVGNYYFAGNICVDNIGTGAMATCATDNVSNEELLLILPWITQETCTAINDILNVGTPLADTGTSFSNTKFTGSFADGYVIGKAATTAYPAACYQSSAGVTPGAGYHFYYSLLQR